MIKVCVQASILKPKGNFHVNPLKTSREVYPLHQESLTDLSLCVSDHSSFFYRFMDTSVPINRMPLKITHPGHSVKSLLILV